jgi:hypothetical protein
MEGGVLRIVLKKINKHENNNQELIDTRKIQLLRAQHRHFKYNIICLLRKYIPCLTFDQHQSDQHNTWKPIAPN